MAQLNKTFNLATFFCLYIAQAIPMSFFSTIIPVFMRQSHFTLSTIGLIQLIKLPWILKFLWSPLVDRKARTTSDFKRWIITSELIYATLIFAVGLLDFKLNFYIFIGLIILAFLASATQDIATDAMAVLAFEKKDKSMVNSMQSMGSFGGALIGGSILLHYVRSGNRNLDELLPFLAIFVLIALMPLILNRHIEIQPKTDLQRANMKDILRFFTQKRIYRQIGFLLLYYSGVTALLAMIKPYMVDLGISTADIGLVNGIGTCIGCLSAFAGGFIIKHFGRHFSRILFAALILISTLFFVGMSFIEKPTIYHIIIGLCALWGSYGMASIIVYTTAMDNVRKGREGIDFTMQTVVTHISGLLCVVIGGFIAHHFNYRGLFIFETFMAATSLTYCLFMFKKVKIK